MARPVLMALIALALPSSAEPIGSVLLSAANDSASVIVRIHHSSAIDGFTCATFKVGEKCLDLTHWRIAIGAREFSGTELRASLDELGRVVGSARGTASGTPLSTSTRIVLCVGISAPFAIAKRLIERCDELGLRRIAIRDGDEAPARIDELIVSLSFDRRTMKASRRIGSREFQSDEELLGVVKELRERNERDGNAETFVTLDVDGEIDWSFAAAAADACRRAGVRSVDLVLSRGQRQTPPPSQQETGKAPTAPVELKHVDPATAGTIAGTIWFEGTAPARVTVDLSFTPECNRVHTGPVPDERLIVTDGRVQNAFVRLDVGDAYEPPSEAAELDQKGCLFVPHVLAVQSGQPLRVRNSDPFLHNVHTLARSTRATPDVAENNIAMSKPGVRALELGIDEGVVKVKCDVHPWMLAWVMVVPHPFFAVSASDGSYTIKNVPPGEYDLVLHHERFANDRRARVKVSTGSTTSQDFTLKLD